MTKALPVLVSLGADPDVPDKREAVPTNKDGLCAGANSQPVSLDNKAVARPSGSLPAGPWVKRL